MRFFDPDPRTLHSRAIGDHLGTEFRRPRKCLKSLVGPIPVEIEQPQFKVMAESIRRESDSNLKFSFPLPGREAGSETSEKIRKEYYESVIGRLRNRKEIQNAMREPKIKFRLNAKSHGPGRRPTWLLSGSAFLL